MLTELLAFHQRGCPVGLLAPAASEVFRRAGASGLAVTFVTGGDGKLVTAYTLLETRFGMATRRFTAIVFLATRGLADSVRVFATAMTGDEQCSVFAFDAASGRYETNAR